MCVVHSPNFKIEIEIDNDYVIYSLNPRDYYELIWYFTGYS